MMPRNPWTDRERTVIHQSGRGTSMPCDGCGCNDGFLTMKKLCSPCQGLIEYKPDDLKRSLAHLRLMIIHIEKKLGDKDASV